MPAIDLSGMTDAELTDLIARIQRVLTRRAIPRQIDQLTRAYLEAKGIAEGDSWSPPEDAFESYPKGWRVTHNGVTWRSTVHGNTAEPGVGTDWREVGTGGGGDTPPAWVQPTDPYRGYAAGVLVSHSGQVWRSLVDANIAAPGSNGGWEVVVV